MFLGLLAALLGVALAALLPLDAQLVSEGPRRDENRAEAPPSSPPLPIALDPQTFAPGGCVALPARGPASRGTVLIDAGHGGPDPGSLGTTPAGRTVSESELTLPVALAVASRLRERGITAVLSRSTAELGTTIGPDDLQNGALTRAASREDLLGRVRCANLARADLLVSVHFNSYTDLEVTGSETIYDADRPLAPRSRALAESLQTNIRTGLAALGEPAPDRGVIDDSSGGEADSGGLVLLGPAEPGRLDEPSAMPGALVEPLFMTDPAGLSAAATPRGIETLADSIATGVQESLDAERSR